MVSSVVLMSMGVNRSVRIKFSDLKEISESLRRKDEGYLVDYLNSFKGDNVFEKFKDILKNWENDVSYDLNLSLDDKIVKVQLEYIINELPYTLGEPILDESSGISSVMDVPTLFSPFSDMIPIYDLIKSIQFSNVKIDFNNLKIDDKKNLLDNLPAHVYNSLIHKIARDQKKTITFNNKTLSTLKINFLSNDPYLFLKGLFNPYNTDYFRDIIYVLTKKIGSTMLMNSTMMDIEYYIEKLNNESREETIPDLS